MNKERMQSYNTRLETNNTSLDDILSTINTLPEINTTEIRIEPTSEEQIITPEEPYNGFDKVTVNAIPNEYVIAKGTIEITENGTYDVKEKESANVNILEKVLGTKTITKNGTYNASDDSLDGYSSVDVDIDIIDITEYFAVPTSFFNLYKTIKKFPNYTYEFLETQTTLNSAFTGIESLEEIQTFNCSKVQYISNQTFIGCKNLLYIGGFIDLGKSFDKYQVPNSSSMTIDLTPCVILYEQSAINVLNAVYDIASFGCKTQQIKLGSPMIEKLNATEEGQQAIASAQAKGWSVL